MKIQSLILSICLLILGTSAIAEDGLFTTGVTSNADMFRVISCLIWEEDGEKTAEITLSGHGYGYLYLGTAKDAASDPDGWIPYRENWDGKYCFRLPLQGYDQGIAVAAYSIKYDKWYDRTLVFSSSNLQSAVRTAPNGVYEGILQLGNGDCLPVRLSASNGDMLISALSENFQQILGQASLPLPSLDLRIPVSGAVSWMRLDEASLSPASEIAGDGVYLVNAETDSPLLKIISCELHTFQGQMTARLTLANASYSYLYAGSAKDAKKDSSGWIAPQIMEDGTAVFDVPVESLDNTFPLATYSEKKKMWYDRSLRLPSDQMEAVE